MEGSQINWESWQEGMKKNKLDGEKKEVILRRPKWEQLLTGLNFVLKKSFKTLHPFPLLKFD